MNIDAKILIPFIGVILGWLLSSLTNLFKVKGEKRRILGKSISLLYHITSELRILIDHIEKIKDVTPKKDWEAKRQVAIERYTLRNKDSLKQINMLVDNVSSISPFTGIKLKKLLEMYLFNREMKLDTSKQIESLYIYLLSIFEVSQDMTLMQLEKILIKLSFQYSFILGIRVKMKLKREKKSAGSLSNNLTDNLYEIMKEL